MAAKKWFDLASHGYFVGAARLRDGVQRILLLDVEDKADADKLLAAGFARTQGSPAYERGLYFLARDDQRIKGAELAAALGLPNCPMVIKESDEIAREFQAAFKDKIGKNLWTALQQSRQLGRNKDGYLVYESNTGRLIQWTNDNGDAEIVAANSKAGRELGAGAFLYADDAESLADCAQGFFGEIRAGARKDWSDMERATRAAYARHLVNGEVSDMQLKAFQEAVEAAGYRAFNSRPSRKIDKLAFTVAEDYYNGLPVARMRTAESIALQQYSTPLPMGVIAQRLLVGNEDFQGKTFVEPTAGNGGLLTLVNKGGRVFAIELDSKRASVLKANNCEKVVVGDAVELNYRRALEQPDGFDYSITNPPFGAMERDRSFEKLPRVRRADYYIALKTLEARKPEGRSVLILGGDDARNPGEFRGGTKAFLEYVYDHYEVLGAVELDGRMYAKQGAGANVRLFSVGARREVPLTMEIPERLPVIRTYAEAWDWAERVVETYPAAVVEAVTVVEPERPEFELQGDSPAQAPVMASVEADAGAAPASAPVKSAPERKVNEYQAPYQSASKVAPPTGMVPINLAGATYGALADLESKVGPIDDYVASKLQYAKEDLGGYFSPEQVDALGLAISKMDDGRAFTNSDFTGFGKGRFCAAMLRYAKLEGKVPVFLTLKPELFTDIFRDLKDIGSDDLFRSPFIFNEGVGIMQFGSGSDVLHPATSASARKAALDGGVLPEGTDLVLATYSQFQRRPEINRKAGFLAEIARQGTAFVVDEAHVAAGESNISASIGAALSETDAVVYASATPFKGVASFHIYSRMFPKSVDLASLPETLKAGGEALMEAISSNMARDGVFIRRELDLSKLEFASREPSPERTQFNRDVSDKVARILSRMSYLSGDVSKEVNELNAGFKKQLEGIPENERQGARMQASSMNFGSRLYSLNRQFLLSLVVEDAADAAIQALKEGRKPVIAVENTGESLLREVLQRRANVADLLDEIESIKARPGDDAAAAQERLDALKEQVDSRMAAVKLEKPPQFRDLLEVMLDRIGVIKVQERYGEYSTHRPSSEEYQEEAQALRELIRELPDMPLSALDVINQRLRQQGYEPAEVSGRTVSLHQDLEGGQWVPTEHKKANAVANVAGFQNGQYDCITITRAGSTGISLHATNRFADSDIRQREFIIAQKAANIAEYLQWMGRVNRRDQVCHPIMRSLETALPAESRLTMMHNSKLRRLSANTTSNRDNSNISDESLDLLNDLGDEIALEWLVENPRFARDLDIDLPTDENSLDARAQDNPYINKLMGRLVMLPVAKQEEILATLSQRFQAKVEEMEQRGVNPFKVDVYEWGARVVAEDELVAPTLKITSSTFDEPVKIVKLHYEEEVVPIREAKLIEMIRAGMADYHEAFGHGEEGTTNRARFREAVANAAEAFVHRQLPDELRDAVEAGTKSIHEALEHEKAASAKRAEMRMRTLVNGWPQMLPGTLIEFDDPIKGTLKGYVTDVSLPRPEALTLLGDYRMRVVFPGESGVKTVSLATMFNQDKSLGEFSSLRINTDKPDNGIASWMKREYDKLMSGYNDVPDGLVTRSAIVLSGNIFRSVELASNNALGNPILYTDAEGNRQRAVLVRSHISPEKLKSMPIGMDADDVAQYIRAVDAKFEALPDKGYKPCVEMLIFNNALLDGPEDGGIVLSRRTPGHYMLRLPGTKKHAGGLMADGRIFDIGPKTPPDSLRLKLAGTRKTMSCKVEEGQLPELLTRMSQGHHVSRFFVHDLDLEVIKQLQKANRESTAALAQSRDTGVVASLG